MINGMFAYVGRQRASAVSSNGKTPSLGRSLDVCTQKDAPAEVRRPLDALRTYLAAAGRELAQREGARAYPALAALANDGNASLDYAVVEFLAAADLTPAGKIWLRDG